jgi:1,4-dihydroxy-2-naphthoate octaprenyltransferase
LFAVVAHAGANVINDYYDARNGSDAANTDRVFPFTGGSRFIQNGVFTPQATAAFGYRLLLAVIPAGLWLAVVSDARLIAIGLAGLLVGWGYSAPPLRLQSRGLGEFGITAGWLLIVIGTDFVQRRGFACFPVAAGLGYALMVANVLYINQFPDVSADGLAGKRTAVVRLGVRHARWGYVLIAALAHLGLLAWVLAGVLPRAALLGLVSSVPVVAALRVLWPNAGQPARLAPAIQLTIVATLLHGAALAIGLSASR